MKLGTVYVMLAEGFEEIEALTPVDTLRRAGVQLKTVGVTGIMVVGGQGITVKADLDGQDFVLPEDASAVLLPGGGLGTENLLKSSMVASVLKQAASRDLLVAAICAAPLVLQQAGLLKGKRVTAYPSVQPDLLDCNVTGSPVEVDQNIITGRSAGVALQFSYAVIAAVCGSEKANQVVGELYPETQTEKT